ncbi:class I SAM-dependent methyltransferase [Ruicaihuangia caeni]|uniref:class I SAM-dependent methyltransferase n=1 Tax=Ruicaihuangia caeni TaxID=3042517 RepID=UPI00338E3C52
MTPAAFSFDRLRRRPDVEAPSLHAVDAADRMLLDLASGAAPDLVEHLREQSAGGFDALAGRDVSVIGDAYGAVTLGALELGGARRVRVHQDPLSAEQALDANAAEFAPGALRRFEHHPLAPSLVADAETVLVKLPRSLDALEEIAGLVATGVHRDAVVLAAGMVKHMTPAMNELLGRWFERVDVARARQKARALVLNGPRATAEADAWPRCLRDDDLGLAVCAHGAAFAGPRVDLGTRLLLATLEAEGVDRRGGEAIDLGCGTGVIATWLAQRGMRVLATDQSAAAVASAAATARANGVADRVVVERDDALQGRPPASARLIVLNPPFHVGSTVHAGIATKLFEAAARVLQPGGELWCVWNSHLQYAPQLRRLVGPTRQAARTPKFTVTVSTRR